MKLAALLALAFAGTLAFAGKNSDHFKEMDANNDGRITQAEHETAATSKFSKADANQDGSLTKGELVGFMVDHKGKSGRKAERKTDDKISMFDANKDGVL